jgi:nitrogen regulatory protein P-II 1
MKRIDAIIRHEKLGAVRIGLDEVGCGKVTTFEARGHGAEVGAKEVWKGKIYRADLLPKSAIMLIVEDSEVDKVVKSIIENAKTGAIGDGKVFVSNIEAAYKIRSGEEGVSSL